MRRDLERYMRFQYPYELDRDGDSGTFFARHADLPGCAAQGASPDEAVRNLDAARRLWIRARLEDGLHVPEPAEDEPSGRVSLRMPTSLHAELNRVASRKEVSLNLMLNVILRRVCRPVRLPRGAARASRDDTECGERAATGRLASAASLLDPRATRGRPPRSGARGGRAERARLAAHAHVPARGAQPGRVAKGSQPEPDAQRHSRRVCRPVRLPRGAARASRDDTECGERAATGRLVPAASPLVERPLHPRRRATVPRRGPAEPHAITSRAGSRRGRVQGPRSRQR